MLLKKKKNTDFYNASSTSQYNHNRTQHGMGNKSEALSKICQINAGYCVASVSFKQVIICLIMHNPVYYKLL